MISTRTLAFRTRILPRRTTYLGLIVAVILLGGHYAIFWAPVVFPLWVLLISLHMLVADLRQEE